MKNYFEPKAEVVMFTFTDVVLNSQPFDGEEDMLSSDWVSLE